MFVLYKKTEAQIVEKVIFLELGKNYQHLIIHNIKSKSYGYCKTI